MFSHSSLEPGWFLQRSGSDADSRATRRRKADFALPPGSLLGAENLLRTITGQELAVAQQPDTRPYKAGACRASPGLYLAARNPRPAPDAPVSAGSCDHPPGRAASSRPRAGPRLRPGGRDSAAAQCLVIIPYQTLRSRITVGFGERSRKGRRVIGAAVGLLAAGGAAMSMLVSVLHGCRGVAFGRQRYARHKPGCLSGSVIIGKRSTTGNHSLPDIAIAPVAPLLGVFPDGAVSRAPVITSL